MLEALPVGGFLDESMLLWGCHSLARPACDLGVIISTSERRWQAWSAGFCLPPPPASCSSSKAGSQDSHRVLTSKLPASCRCSTAFLTLPETVVPGQLPFCPKHSRPRSTQLMRMRSEHSPCPFSFHVSRKWLTPSRHTTEKWRPLDKEAQKEFWGIVKA